MATWKKVAIGIVLMPWTLIIAGGFLIEKELIEPKIPPVPPQQ